MSVTPNKYVYAQMRRLNAPTLNIFARKGDSSVMSGNHVRETQHSHSIFRSGRTTTDQHA